MGGAVAMTTGATLTATISIQQDGARNMGRNSNRPKVVHDN